MTTEVSDALYVVPQAANKTTAAPTINALSFIIKIFKLKNLFMAADFIKYHNYASEIIFPAFFFAQCILSILFF